MAALQKPVPVILCGKGELIGRPVIAGLQPEYEVVQFIMGTDATIAEIPTILRGQTPSSPSSTLGSGDYSRRPVAVILGGGYTDVFDQVHEGVEAAFSPEGRSSGVAWLRFDPDKPMPPLGPEYAAQALHRLRDKLEALVAEGKLGNGETAVYQY